MGRVKIRTPIQVGRVLYVLVGCFFVSAEIAFIWFGVDWFQWSNLH